MNIVLVVIGAIGLFWGIGWLFRESDKQTQSTGSPAAKQVTVRSKPRQSPASSSAIPIDKAATPVKAAKIEFRSFWVTAIRILSAVIGYMIARAIFADLLETQWCPDLELACVKNIAQLEDGLFQLFLVLFYGTPAVIGVSLLLPPPWRIQPRLILDVIRNKVLDTQHAYFQGLFESHLLISNNV